MRLSLIGMSGSGKSTWSSKLAESGFKRFCCDDLIAAKLDAELMQPDGSVKSLGEWMGFPYEPRYEACEAQYLACEIEVLEEILGGLERVEGRWEEDVVIDTTGSVIHTGEPLLQRLRRQTSVVHLVTPPEILESMLKAYIAEPRPVLWMGMFRKLPNEGDAQALARCYPALLARRETLYAQYADVTIGYDERARPGFNVQDLLNLIRARSPRDAS